jgi:hypothetical protein
MNEDHTRIEPPRPLMACYRLACIARRRMKRPVAVRIGGARPQSHDALASTNRQSAQRSTPWPDMPMLKPLPFRRYPTRQ